MVYLGINTDQASALARVLRSTSVAVQPIERAVAEARVLAHLTIPIDGLLDEIEADCRTSAARIEQAIQRIDRHNFWFQPWAYLPEERPGAAPGAAPALWNAEPTMPWNEVRQSSSHNSYVVAGGIDALYDLGVRSFELDIHRGAPTDFLGGRWDELLLDHATHGGGRRDDWRVFHTSFDPDSEYDYLSDGLRELAALPASDPLTVFVDVKDRFAGSHTGSALDELLLEILGDRIFGPADIIARAPGAGSLQDAIHQAGWPTVEELHGRVLVVLTGSTRDYDSAAGQAFVAGGGIADLDHLFHNISERFLSAIEVALLLALGRVVRTYGDDGCPDHAEPAAPNYVAVDIESGGYHCLDLP